MTVALTEAVTSLAEAERRLNLSRTEEEAFFSEWRTGLPVLSGAESTALDDLRRRYLYQRSESQLPEGTVTLLMVSPLLTVAGFYDPPFKVRTEASVQLSLADGEEVLQGRIDVLVLLDQLWVVIVESKQTALSAWTALPQTLAYLMANPQPERPSFAMVTNGDDIFFVKLVQQPQPRYAVSRVFAPLADKGELYSALQILKQFGQVMASGL